MEKEQKEKILNKLKKLIAMQTSPFPNEVETASRLLKELMIKHNIDFNQIKEIKDKVELVDKSILETNTIRPKHWLRYLFKEIGEFYDCEVYFNNKGTFTFVGFDIDRKVAIHQSEYLKKNLEIYAEKTVNKYSYMGAKQGLQNDFCLGAVNSISIRLREIKQSITNTNETGLIILKEIEVDNFMKNIKLTPDRYSPNIRNSAMYHEGETHGKFVGLNQQIGESG